MRDQICSNGKWRDKNHESEYSRRIGWWERRRPTWACVIGSHWGWRYELRSRVVERLLFLVGGVVVDILFDSRRLLSRAALGLLLAHPVHTRARVDVVINGPVGALPAVRQRSWDFLKAGIERQVVSDRILERTDMLAAVCTLRLQETEKTEFCWKLIKARARCRAF